MQLRRDPEALEDLAGPRLEGVAVSPQDDVLEFRVAVGFEVVLGAGEDPFLLGHRVPQRPVAHHHDIEDAVALVPEVVLAQDAQPRALRDRELPGAGGLLAGENPQQRGFATAIGADDAVALARVELERSALEEQLVAVVLREIGQGDHGLGRLASDAFDRASAGCGTHSALLIPGGRSWHEFQPLRTIAALPPPAPRVRAPPTATASTPTPARRLGRRAGPILCKTPAYAERQRMRYANAGR